MFVDDERADALIFIVAERDGDLATLRAAGGHVERDAADDIDVFRVLVLALGDVHLDDALVVLARLIS